MQIGDGISGAVFSPDRSCRYALWRIWDREKESVLFIGLNPSKADEIRDDNTVAKCARYSKEWGYGGLYMGNAFSVVSTYPEIIHKMKELDEEENDQALLEMSRKAGIIILGWGNYGAYLGRSDELRKMFPEAHCLAHNKKREPSHPLYLPSHYFPIEYKPNGEK